MGNLGGAQEMMSKINPAMGQAMGAFNQGAAGNAAKPRRLTKEEREYETAQREVDRMQKESAKFEAPESYAKYAKMQRQILKMEKELKGLKQKADESQKRPPEEDEQDDDS